MPPKIKISKKTTKQKQGQKQSQNVVVHVHTGEPRKKSAKKSTRKTPAKNPTMPFFQERIVVPQIQMRPYSMDTMNYNKMFDLMRAQQNVNVPSAMRNTNNETMRQERPFEQPVQPVQPAPSFQPYDDISDTISDITEPTQSGFAIPEPTQRRFIENEPVPNLSRTEEARQRQNDLFNRLDSVNERLNNLRSTRDDSSIYTFDDSVLTYGAAQTYDPGAPSNFYDFEEASTSTGSTLPTNFSQHTINFYRDKTKRAQQAEVTPIIDDSLDNYEILGLKEGATEKEILKAHREKAKKWHPDKYVNKSPEERQIAADNMATLNKAKTMLLYGDVDDDLSKRSHESYQEAAAAERMAEERAAEKARMKAEIKEMDRKLKEEAKARREQEAKEAAEDRAEEEKRAAYLKTPEGMAEAARQKKATADRLKQYREMMEKRRQEVKKTGKDAAERKKETMEILHKHVTPKKGDDEGGGGGGGGGGGSGGPVEKNIIFVVPPDTKADTSKHAVELNKMKQYFETKYGYKPKPKGRFDETVADLRLNLPPEVYAEEIVKPTNLIKEKRGMSKKGTHIKASDFYSYMRQNKLID